MSIDRIAKVAGILLLSLTIVVIALTIVPQAHTQGPSVTPLNGQDSVTITKTLETNLVIPGQPVTYTIHYQITATSVTTVTITDTLPVSTTWRSDTAPALGFTRTQTTTHAVWTTPTLSSGSGSFQLSLNVPADVSATIRPTPSRSARSCQTPLRSVALSSSQLPWLTISSSCR